MNVKVFQFNGCNKCFSESILLKNEADFETEYIANPLEWKEEKMDIAVITGFLLPENQEILNKISKNSDRMIAYGDCTTTGGVFGLAKQRGHDLFLLRLMDV